MISVDLAKLYHHYYNDTFGKNPPSPDPTQFEHTRFLLPTQEFRLAGGGIGASTLARRAKSAELGQAFCRWFLDEHQDISYFAHISELIDRQNVRGLGGVSIKRVSSGDVPDYFCADRASNTFLAEAKGRYTSINFSSKEFEKWRSQFSRVEVLDAKGVARAVKGHIVATRLATEEDSVNIHSMLFAEDPTTIGEGILDDGARHSLSTAIVGLHYARFVQKMNQPLLATALRYGMNLPDEIRVPVVLWKLALDANDDRLFVGGYYPGPTGESAFSLVDGGLRPRAQDPLRLDQPLGTFVGIEEKVFRSLVASRRPQGDREGLLRQPVDDRRIYSAISILSDGSAVGPVEYFAPVRIDTL